MGYRLQLIIGYDGSPFAGWQSQPNRNGVQDHLERAFAQIAGSPIRVHGAGRTDAGVHALAQSAHVDLASQKLTPQRWVTALNAMLPPTIRVLRCRWVGPEFHARFSALGKVYRYCIYRGPVMPPLYLNRAWHLSAALDNDRFRQAAATFVGTHDFAAFAANRGKPESDTKRTLHSVKVRLAGPRIELEFDGDGFLYKMVRLLVGAIVQCGRGKISPDEIADLLITKRKPGSRLVAPAAGLFLVRVRY